MRHAWMALLSVGALAATACGGATATSGSDAQSNVTTYQALASKVDGAATSYGAATPGMTSVAKCQSLENAYDQKVRPWVTQMMHMSAGMDDWMGMHNAGSAADLECASAGMMDELSHHHAVACASNLAADRDEAQRHVQAMHGFAHHMFQRCGEMMDAVDGQSPMWGPMMQSCGNWNGHGGMMGGGGYGGMMGGGGHMMGGSGYGGMMGGS